MTCGLFSPTSRKCIRFSIFAVIALLSSNVAAASQAALNLEDCVVLAQQNNLDLKAKQAEIYAYEAQSAKTLTAYLPKVDANFQRTRTKIDRYENSVGDVESDGFGNQLSLTVKESLDLRGDVWRSYGRSDDQLTAKTKEYEHAISATMLEVVDLFYGAQEASSRIENLKVRVERQQALVRQVRVEVQVGKKARVDLEELEHEAARIDLEMLQAQQDLETSIKKLAVKVYGSGQHQIEIEDANRAPAFIADWQSTVEQTSLESLRSTLESRGDIQAQKYQVAIAASRKNENYWSYVPEMSLMANYARDFSRWSNDREPQKPDVELTYGLVASWNLFNGGSDYYQLREDAQTERQAVLRLETSRAGGMVELVDARDKIKTSERLWKASEQLFLSAQKRHGAIKAQYDIGKRSITDLLAAQVDLSDSEIEVAKTRYAFYIQYAQYLHLTGTLQSTFKGTAR